MQNTSRIHPTTTTTTTTTPPPNNPILCMPHFSRHGSPLLGVGWCCVPLRVAQRLGNEHIHTQASVGWPCHYCHGLNPLQHHGGHQCKWVAFEYADLVGDVNTNRGGRSIRRGTDPLMPDDPLMRDRRLSSGFTTTFPLHEVLSLTTVDVFLFFHTRIGFCVFFWGGGVLFWLRMLCELME